MLNTYVGDSACFTFSYQKWIYNQRWLV